MEAWRDELYHYGIKNQKWGVRRYQNEDGSLTLAGKARYRKPMTKKEHRQYSDERREVAISSLKTGIKAGVGSLGVSVLARGATSALLAAGAATAAPIVATAGTVGIVGLSMYSAYQGGKAIVNGIISDVHNNKAG